MSEKFRGVPDLEKEEKERREKERREVIRKAQDSDEFVPSRRVEDVLNGLPSYSQQRSIKEEFKKTPKFTKETIRGLISSIIDEVNRRVYGLTPEFMESSDRVEIEQIIKEHLD